MLKPKLTTFVVMGEVKKFSRYPWDEPAIFFMDDTRTTEWLIREFTDDVLRDLPGYGVSDDPGHRSYRQ